MEIDSGLLAIGEIGAEAASALNGGTGQTLTPSTGGLFDLREPHGPKFERQLH